MSFRCDNCNGKNSGKPHIVTVKTRETEHVEMRPGEEYGQMVPMIVGMGTQIVAQQKRCNHCV